MTRRAVYLRASGHFSARGEGLAAVAGALRRSETAHARRHLAHREWPFFACHSGRADARDAARDMVLSVARQLKEELDNTAPPAIPGFNDIPLFIGSSSGFIGLMEKSGEAAQGNLPPAADYGTQIARWIGTRFPPRCFSTACTSSIAALDTAALLIGCGHLDRALVIGMELANDTTLGGFASLGLLTQKHGRPLDAARDGMVLGEAVAGILLTAEAPSGATHAWRLAGLDMRLETHSITGPDPEGRLVAQTMRNALAQAALSPSAIDAIKLQASGSPSADLAEAVAIRGVFGESPPPLVSLKPYFGHTLGASGMVELSALTACLDDGWLPATPGFSHEDPAIGLVPTTERVPIDAHHVLFNLSGFGAAATLVISRHTPWPT